MFRVRKNYPNSLIFNKLHNFDNIINVSIDHIMLLAFERHTNLRNLPSERTVWFVQIGFIGK